jgi:hypothetical protein
MIDKIGGERSSLDLIGCEVTRELIEDRGNDFQMRELFRAY